MLGAWLLSPRQESSLKKKTDQAEEKTSKCEQLSHCPNGGMLISGLLISKPRGYPALSWAHVHTASTLCGRDSLLQMHRQPRIIRHLRNTSSMKDRKEIRKECRMGGSLGENRNNAGTEETLKNKKDPQKYTLLKDIQRTVKSFWK